MRNVIELPFAIGEQVWSVGSGHDEVRVTCPECDGTKAIEMVKGNGERVTLDCGLCAPGYERPRGWITQHVYNCKPTPFTPRQWDKSCGEFTFSESNPDATCFSYAYAKDLFRDRDECQRRCDELNMEYTENQERMTLANISSKRESLAFSATYWAHEVARKRKELALAEARLARCKKPKVNSGEVTPLPETWK